MTKRVGENFKSKLSALIKSFLICLANLNTFNKSFEFNKYFVSLS